MKNTHFSVPISKQLERAAIKGVDFLKRRFLGAFSTADDCLHFQPMPFNNGELFGHRRLIPDVVRMMRSNQIGDIDLTSDPTSRKGMSHGYSVGIALDP